MFCDFILETKYEWSRKPRICFSSKIKIALLGLTRPRQFTLLKGRVKKEKVTFPSSFRWKGKGTKIEQWKAREEKGTKIMGNGEEIFNQGSKNRIFHVKDKLGSGVSRTWSDRLFSDTIRFLLTPYPIRLLKSPIRSSSIQSGFKNLRSDHVRSNLVF